MLLSGGYIKTVKTENFLGKREKLCKNELFYSDRNIFVAKSREFSRFLCRNTPPRGQETQEIPETLRSSEEMISRLLDYCK